MVAGNTQWKGINPMGLGVPCFPLLPLGAPWEYYYIHNLRDELLPVMFINQFLECPSFTSSSTDETNANNKQQEEIMTIDLNPVKILITTSEISSHPQKIGKR